MTCNSTDRPNIQPPADFEHLVIDVRVQYKTGRSDLFRHAGRQVASATSDVQRLVARPQSGAAQREVLPDTVQATRHQGIHDVLLRCNRIKDRAHPAGFFGGGDGLEAEMSLFHAPRFLPRVLWLYSRVRIVPCRTRSNRHTAAAAAIFSDSVAPGMGIATMSFAASSTARDSPAPSLPNTRPMVPLRSVS